jgi:hypothetical protein
MQRIQVEDALFDGGAIEELADPLRQIEEIEALIARDFKPVTFDLHLACGSTDVRGRATHAMYFAT